MRMKRVCDSRFQVVARKRSTQSRHVKVGLLKTATQFDQHLLNVCFGLGMVDKFRLHHRKNLRDSLRRHGILNLARIHGGESFLDQVSRQLREIQATLAGRVEKNSTSVQVLPPVVIAHRGIDEYIHFTQLPSSVSW